MAEPTATQIIAGQATLYVAVVGTAPPAVTGTPAPWPPVWIAAWKAVGYTDKGVDVIYTPTVKPYTPDEETASVYDVLTAEKVEVSAVLAETTFDNLNRAISASTLTDDTASKVRKLSVGSQALNYVAIGIQGPTPVADGSGAEIGDGEVHIIQKALVSSSFTLAMSKKDVRKYTVKFEARKIAGQDLIDFYQFYH